jgi:hypothetical protein
MGGKKDGIEETPQQRAMTEFAVNQMADWKQRWLPLQKNLAKQITSMGARGSKEREQATGRAAGDVEATFARGGGAVSRALTNAGAGPGSSKFNLATVGQGDDKAKSRGLGVTVADQQIDDAYIAGLQSLTRIGRGEKAQVADSLGTMAASSARQASADAEMSAMERAGNMRIAARLAGYGLQSALSDPGPQPVGSVPGGYSAAGDSRRFNNPSAYTPAG